MVGKKLTILAMAGFAALSVPALGQMRITEYMYNSLGTAPNNQEYVEFSNVGAAPIDMTGWSFDDSSRTAGSMDLSAFGVVNPGESVVMCDGDASNFRTVWSIPLSVDIVGGNINNLGRADEINLYDNTGALVDRLTYDDQVAGPPLGGPRTQGISGWICTEYLGANIHAEVRLSSSGDVQGSYVASNGDIGNPGTHVGVLCNAPVPTVSEWGLAVLALVGLIAGTVMFGRTNTVRA